MTGYVFNFEGHGPFDPNGKVDVPDVAAHNADLERAEMNAWRDKPDRFFAYIVKRDGAYVATTWLGTVIGRVTRRNVYRGNFGRMESIRVHGTNGVDYHGRKSHDWADCIRLRSCK